MIISSPSVSTPQSISLLFADLKIGSPLIEHLSRVVDATGISNNLNGLLTARASAVSSIVYCRAQTLAVDLYGLADTLETDAFRRQQ
jgi:hypothetical protein